MVFKRGRKAAQQENIMAVADIASPLTPTALKVKIIFFILFPAVVFA